MFLETVHLKINKTNFKRNSIKASLFNEDSPTILGKGLPRVKHKELNDRPWAAP